ncbi:hypothetical protein [Enterococcus sp. AZ109]|uniref:hypothetical protein n=1 Tax=Enterococcus sp. AZ109 TaxID=2774634 RepID=UPI003F21093E
MKYRVLQAFVDKETGREYTEKDFYESKDENRIKELSTRENLAKVPLIRKVVEKGEKGEKKNG